MTSAIRSLITKATFVRQRYSMQAKISNNLTSCNSTLIYNLHKTSLPNVKISKNQNSTLKHMLKLSWRKFPARQFWPNMGHCNLPLLNKQDFSSPRSTGSHAVFILHVSISHKACAQNAFPSTVAKSPRQSASTQKELHTASSCAILATPTPRRREERQQLPK